jgi:hypothetical protein
MDGVFFYQPEIISKKKDHFSIGIVVMDFKKMPESLEYLYK